MKDKVIKLKSNREFYILDELTIKRIPNQHRYSFFVNNMIVNKVMDNNNIYILNEVKNNEVILAVIWTIIGTFKLLVL